MTAEAEKKKVLVVGDGDLSYCAALSSRWTETTIVATTYLTREELDETYGKENIEKHIQNIQSFSNVVVNGVDAVNLKDTLLPHLPFTINEEKGEEGTAREIFDLIIWNFPHFGGKSRIQKNRQLIRGFFQSSSPLVKEKDGEIWLSLCRGQGGSPNSERASSLPPSSFSPLLSLLLSDPPSSSPSSPSSSSSPSPSSPPTSPSSSLTSSPETRKRKRDEEITFSPLEPPFSFLSLPPATPLPPKDKQALHKYNNTWKPIEMGCFGKLVAVEIRKFVEISGYSPSGRRNTKKAFLTDGAQTYVFMIGREGGDSVCAPMHPKDFSFWIGKEKQKGDHDQTKEKEKEKEDQQEQKDQQKEQKQEREQFSHESFLKFLNQEVGNEFIHSVCLGEVYKRMTKPRLSPTPTSSSSSPPSSSPILQGVSLLYRVNFQSKGRALTLDRVNEFFEQIRKKMPQIFNIQMR